MKKKNLNKILLACAMSFAMSASGAVAYQYMGNEPQAITASAENYGVVKLTSCTETSWLASNNRLVFNASGVAAGTYTLSGSITLIRDGVSYKREYAFNAVHNANGNYYIDNMWVFGNDLGVTYVHQAGDRYVIEGVFSNASNSFTVEPTTIVIESLNAEGKGLVQTVVEETADVNIVKLTSCTETTWLASNNRLVFNASGVPAGTYTLSGSITLIRDGVSYKREYAFNAVHNANGNYYIDNMWVFGNDLGVTYVHQAGDRYVIEGVFSNASNSFTVEPTTIVIESLNADGKGLVQTVVEETPPAEEETVTEMGRASTELEHTWMNRHQYVLFKLSQQLPTGTYYADDINNITVIRDGVTHKPSANKLQVIVQSDKIFVDQTGYFETIRTSWSDVFKDGDIVVIEGVFKNESGSFKVDKTSILVESTTVQTVMPLVTWNNADGQKVSEEEIRYNTALKQPADPEKEADGIKYQFVGWYNGDTAWDFSQNVTGDITLTPKFDSYISGGKGYTADALWAGASYYFGLAENSIAAGSYLNPTAESCMQITRNGVTTSLGHSARQTIYKHDANLYIVQSWTLLDWKTLQDGDMLTLQGVWTDGTNNIEIEKTDIRVSDSGTTNDNGEKLFYSTVAEMLTATFELDGATYTSQKVVQGGKLTEPTQPTKAGDADCDYQFDGWYAGSETWDFANDTVTENITLTAVFNAVEKQVISAGYGYNENITTNSTGFYFKMYTNTVPYTTDWATRYKPMTADAIKKIRDGVVTNVGNTAGETIVKYGENSYYVEAWAVGGWQDGDIFILDGKFKNESNGTIFTIAETYIQIKVNTDGSHTDVVLNPTITFLDEKGKEISKETIAYNALVSIPASTPTKAEDEEYIYTFAGWYNGDERWNFTTDIPDGDMTLQAQFTARSKYESYLVEDVVTAADKEGEGFYFYAKENGAPYSSDWDLRYKPTTANAIQRIAADGTVTNVGNTGGETIVKYGKNGYFIEAWAIGGYQAGATYVLNGTFKNAANQAEIVFENVRIQLTETEDGKFTASVLRETFSMVDGASVRLNSEYKGIRFEMELGYTYQEDAQYYMMIVPYNYLTLFNVTGDYYNALVAATQGLGVKIATMQCEPFQYTAEELTINGRNAGSYYIRGSLTDIQYSNINTQFVGIAYKVVNGVYTYAEFNEQNNVRSLAEVASKALSDTATYPNGNEVLEGFVKASFMSAEGKAEGDAYMMPTAFGLNKTTLAGYPVAEQLYINGAPAGADVYAVWSSSDPAIVSVDKYGNVLGISSGSATITATFLGKTYSCQVTNMAGAKPTLEKDGGIVRWDALAGIEEYTVTIVNTYNEKAYEETLKANFIDLTKLGLEVGQTYTVSVAAALNGAIAESLTFTYEDLTAISYAMAEDGEELSIGVWNGSYHFQDENKLKELADAGINLVIGVNPVWHSSEESWMGILDKAYEYGVSFIVDPRAYVNGGYAEWDGTLPDYGKHPAIVGFMAYDEPINVGDNGTSTIFNTLDEAQAKFDAEKSRLGREDLTFFVNILGASGIAGNAGNNTFNYETQYVNPYLDAVDGEVISMDSYSLLKNGSTANIRKSYYYTFDVLSQKAKKNGTDLWYTLLSAGHKAGDGGSYTYSEPTEEELRWQMAVGMVFGAKSLNHYVYTSGAEDYSTMVEYETWNTTALYDRVKKINSEYAAWESVYNNFTWQGYAALDFGQTDNSLFNYKANALLENLTYDVAVNTYGGLQSVKMSDGSDNTASANNAKDLLVGMFKDNGGNMAFMLTNAASAVNTYASSKKYYENLTYSMVDIGTTLTFDAGYTGAIVIKNGVKTYHALTNNQLTLTVGAWEGVFVIPVKAQAQLNTVGGVTYANGMLTWNAVDNANAYEVVVTNANGDTVVDTTVIDTMVSLPKTLGTYTVSVYAKNDGRYQKSVALTKTLTMSIVNGKLTATLS